MADIRRSSRGSIPTEKVLRNQQDAAVAAAAAQAAEAKKEKEEIESTARIIHGFNKPSASNIGVPFLTSTRGVKPYKERMGTIIKTLFPEEVLDSWGKPGRSIYEGSSPPTQCNNTIKKVTANTVCWLCGIKLDLSGANNGMQPICEHVLPIAQAVFFLGLYSTRKIEPSEDIPTRTSKIIDLEYGWSHEVCNGEKSNIVLIKEEYNGPNGTPVWVPDDDAINELLLKIESSKRIDSPTLRGLISRTPGWLTARKKSIFARVKEVTDFINRPAEPGFGNLIQLAGWASLVDPTSMTPAFLDTINVTLPPNATDRQVGKRDRSSSGDGNDSSRKTARNGSSRRTKRKHRKTVRRK